MPIAAKVGPGPAPAHDLAIPEKAPNWRREIKLLVRPELREEILSWLAEVMTPDPQVSNPYRISSLYYDTPDMAVYRHKKDGVEERFKLRVRTYPGAQDSSEGVLEIKWKVGTVSWKDRYRAPLQQLEGLISGALSTNVFPPLARLLARYPFEPKLIVDYQRSAFQDRDGSPLRVTLDGPVRTRSCARIDDLALPGQRPYLVADGYLVLEVKFRDQLPFWLPHLAQRWDLPQLPFSKYIEAVHKILERHPYDLQFAQIKDINDDVLAGILWR